MAKKKAAKELYKKELSRIKKEMAEPRMASSVREKEKSQNGPAGRAAGG
jgi:hypothetical protein